MEKIFLPIARLSPLAAPAAGTGRGRREEEKELREPWVSRDWALESFYSPQYGRDLISQSNSWFHRQNEYMYVGLCIKEGIPPQCEKSRL